MTDTAATTTTATEAKSTPPAADNSGKTVTPPKPKAPRNVTATKPPAADNRGKGSTMSEYRAKAMCFDGRLYKQGETRFSDKELDPKVWEEV